MAIGTSAKTLTCKICYGRPKKAKCLLCGAKPRPQPKTKDEEDPRFEWLLELHAMMKKHQSLGTGCDELDEEVLREIGPWGKHKSVADLRFARLLDSRKQGEITLEGFFEALRESFTPGEIYSRLSANELTAYFRYQEATK